MQRTSIPAPTSSATAREGPRRANTSPTCNEQVEIHLDCSPRRSDGCHGARSQSIMKFRFIMLGPEDEPDALSSALQTSRSGGDDLSRSVCYEQQGTEMVCRA